MNNVTPFPPRPSTDLPEVTEHLNVDKIQTGNSDLGVPEWSPPSKPAERPPQVYPSPSQANVPERRL